MKLEQIAKGQSLAGVEPGVVVTVLATDAIGDGALQVIYKTPDGKVDERMLSRADEATISPATVERPWSFDGDGEAFKLTAEAKRIDLAFLFDPMMAVHTSNVQPLPHQITAVYESMLPKQPLRFVLADDPGAGKTVMAGLYVRELIMRADARRVLVVAPGSLVDQWRDELYEKFGLKFQVFSSALEQSAASGNPFEENHLLIVRLDQMARNEDLQHKLCAAGWDLVIFDEAHKCAAHYDGGRLEKTARFELAERLGAKTRHLLLMTATPHNGKPEDFQLFMSLLDSDCFYGKFRDGVHKVDVTDFMRRMVKEELVKFDNTPLFPQRKAYTVNYPLSVLESELYEAVTKYVQDEMGKAEQLQGPRKGSVGFALTALQRRLASSPEAIFQSLKRRHRKLEERLQEAKLNSRARQGQETLQPVPDDDDDFNAEEQESLEERLVDEATAAENIPQLQDEIRILARLEKQAQKLVESGVDRKWEELSKILQNNPEMHDANGRQRKLIIFSEHRDTLNYLHAKISGVLGSLESIATIHGGTKRDERKKIQGLFWQEPNLRVLIATDAAGEGINLQCAHLMVNYDLPWNPNRLEQRFGRIHRINQTEVCHLWNLVAKETREGAVYHRLLEKLETEKGDLNGRVFNILGDVFEGRSLKDLLIEAIKFGNQPEVRAQMTRKVDRLFEGEKIDSLLKGNALAQESMSMERLFHLKEEMEKAEARKLQPHFVRAFFTKAFGDLGGSFHKRELGRYEITHVPGKIRDRDRLITGRNRRESGPVLTRYERVCFTKEAMRPLEKPGLVAAELMHPGHPLMLSISDLILEQNANLLRQGAILVDPADEGIEASLLFILTHEIKSGDGQTLSKRLQFVRVAPDGKASNAGWAPHLDLNPLPAADRPILQDMLQAPWIRADQEQRALALAATILVPQHFDEISKRRTEHVDRTLAAVHERLTKEINYLTDRWERLGEDLKAGKDVRLPFDEMGKKVRELGDRLENRKKELRAMRHVASQTPVALGGALVVPIGLLNRLKGQVPDPEAADFSADPAARARVERLAMQAVARVEEARGCETRDVSKEKCGWDITSQPPNVDGKLPESIHIEVKGRFKGAKTVTVTSGEIRASFNQGSKFVLAVVFVDESDKTDGPYYVRNPFSSEPDWAEASRNLNLTTLLKKATSQP